MSKILFDIGSLCTKFNFVGQKPFMNSSSTNCFIDFRTKGSTLAFYAKHPNCTADYPYGIDTFYSRDKIIDKNKYSDFLGLCFKMLKCDISEQSVIVLAPPIHQKHFIECTSEILYETYNIQSVSMAPQSVFASENQNFVSVLLGFTDSYVISHLGCKNCNSSLRHIPVGGHQITEYISSSLKGRTVNKNIEEEDMLWLAEHVKLIDRFAYFDSNIEIDDFKHSTPLKSSFKLNPITNQKIYFSFGYERYLATAFTLFPYKIDPTIHNTLADYINESIHDAIIESKSKSSMERTLRSKISIVGGPAAAKGIKYKLNDMFKNKKLKKKKKKTTRKKDIHKIKKNDNIKTDNEKNDNEKDDQKDEDCQNDNDEKEKEDDIKLDDNKNDIGNTKKTVFEDPYLKDPTTQIFRIASNFYEKIGGIFITRESYKENGSTSFFFL